MERKMLLFALLCSIFIAGCSKDSDNETRLINSGRMVVITSVTHNGVTESMTNETFFSGDKVRSSIYLQTPMGEQEFVQIWKGKQLYSFIQGENAGQTMTAPQDWKTSMTDFVRNPELIEASVHQGVEKVAGLDCDVYLYDRPPDKAKLWILKNASFPVLLKSENYEPFVANTNTQEIELNIVIQEDRFALPVNVEFREVNWDEVVGN